MAKITFRKVGNIFFLLIGVIVIFGMSCAYAGDGPNKMKMIRDYRKVDASLKTISGRATTPEKSLYGPGDYERFIKVGKRTRRYSLHIPPSYDRGRATPIVLNFHGGGGRSASARLQTKMDITSDREGFIVVYPDGTGKFKKRFLTWNAGICCGYAQANNVDDVGFVDALLDDLAGFFNVDQQRIYATGFSNGSMMSYRLISELSDRIAAIAPVSAVKGFDRNKAKRPVSIIHFHGLEDQNAPYGGGVGAHSKTKTNFPSAKDNMMFWVKQNRGEFVDKVERKEAVIETYLGSEGSEVVLVSIKRMGHGWPGGRAMLKKSIELEISHSINANDMMWEFFKKHPMK